MTTTFVNNTFVSKTFDWTKAVALANTQGRSEFELTVLNGDGLLDEQLVQLAAEIEQQFKRALELAKQNRRDPEQQFLSAMRNWARCKAFGLLRARVAGKPIRKDYYDVFESTLKEEIALCIMEIEFAWQTQDEQREAAKDNEASVRRAEQDQILQNDHKHVLDAYNELNRAYTGREDAVKAGYEMVGQWADKLETRMQRHENFLEGLGGEMLGIYKDVHMQQRRDTNISFVDNAIQVGGKTLTCLFWLIVACLVVFFGIFLALQLAFHH